MSRSKSWRDITLETILAGGTILLIGEAFDVPPDYTGNLSLATSTVYASIQTVKKIITDYINSGRDYDE